MIVAAEQKHGNAGAESIGGASEIVDSHLGELDDFIDEEGGIVYGRLVVLGFKEYLVRDSIWNPVGKCNEIFPLKRREAANGIRPCGSYFTSEQSAATPRSVSTRREKALRLRHPLATHSVTMRVDLPRSAPPPSSTPTAPRPRPTISTMLRGVATASVVATQTSQEAPEPTRPSSTRLPLPRFRSSAWANTSPRVSPQSSAAPPLSPPSTPPSAAAPRPAEASAGAPAPAAPRAEEGMAVEEPPPPPPSATAAASPSPLGAGGPPAPLEAAGGGGGALEEEVSRGEGGVKHMRMEYCGDENCDMFQIGRMMVEQNDIVIRGPLHRDRNGVLCGPVSRFACRILCQRSPPYTARLFAAGFNGDAEIFLSDSAPKVVGEGSSTGNIDALTTFGVRVWLPSVKAWREVSISASLYGLRPELSVPGAAIVNEKGEKEGCELEDGTILDIAGIQLLWRRGAEGKGEAAAAFASGKEGIVGAIVARRPQCPVQYHTIRFDYVALDEEQKEQVEPERRPFVYPACGHVHAFNRGLKGRPCPMCRTPGPFTELKLEWVPSICAEEPLCVFNPCGHLIGLEAAEFWSTVKLPDNAPPNAKFRPVCCFCSKALKRNKPFSRIIWET